MGVTDPNFWQNKIMISYRNVAFFTICISFDMVLFFIKHSSDKIHEKQKFSALDIAESWSKGM